MWPLTFSVFEEVELKQVLLYKSFVSFLRLKGEKSACIDEDSHLNLYLDQEFLIACFHKHQGIQLPHKIFILIKSSLGLNLL